MTKRERELLLRLYACLNTMTGLGPSNPADARAKLRALDTMTAVSRDLTSALSSIGFGDFDLAADALADAERALGLAAACSPKEGTQR